MHLASTALAAQLLLLRAASAEEEPSWELGARITLWSKEGCAEENFGDADVATSDLEILKDMTIEGKDPDDADLPCSTMSWSPEGFEKAGNEYEAWLDASTIPDKHSVLFHYNGDWADESERNCVDTYHAIESSRGCIKVALPKEFGYSYCSGTKCGQLGTTDELWGKRADLEKDEEAFEKRKELRPVEDIFSYDEPDSVKPRDVTAAKRSAPWGFLDRFLSKREECSFSEEEDSHIEKKYGEFLRVGPKQRCPASNSEGCVVSYSASYAAMQGESFGVGASAGVNLFEIINFSVDMSAEYSTQNTTTLTYTSQATIDPGFVGYITWEPMLECVKGKLSGDCTEKLGDEVETDTDGETCFILANNDLPDGEFSVMRES